jgi:hypothetical protein
VLRIKDMTIEFTPETAGARVEFSTRPCGFSVVLDVNDLEKLAKVFAAEAQKLSQKGF